jgi:hypothetical protein
MHRLGAGQALDGRAAGTVLGEQNDEQTEPDSPLRPVQQERRGRQQRQRHEQKRLARAESIRPDTQRELQKPGQRAQHPDETDGRVGQAALAQI